MEKYRNEIANELKVFEKKFNDAVQSNHSMLDRIMKYIVKRKGKQLRPIFVFLSAKIFGDVNDKTHRAASLVELLHTATLVHDDVVDEAETRRGFFSINALWKNKIAVLVGDYLLSKGLLLSLDNNDFKVLQILSKAVKDMSEGELLQLEKSRKLNIDEATYFKIITNKTASLLASCCAAGTCTTTDNIEDIEKMRLFGEKVGIAFQIKDDLFDYANEDIGKPTGNDIKEKKMTLPLIYTLNNIDEGLRKKIIYIIKNKNTDAKSVAFVIKTVIDFGGIAYANQKMKDYQKEGLDLLHSLPKNNTRDALEELVMYTTERKY
jgi:octaprenyl-diphosphate synthase